MTTYPSDWKVVPLGEFGDVAMCRRVLKSQTMESGDVPFFKIGTFGRAPDAYISHDLYESLRGAYSFPKCGDVLVSAAGTIGRTVVYDGEDAYYQDSNIVWIENDESKVLNSYLYWWYKVIEWKTENGGTVDRLYNKNFLSSSIAYPPLPEQKRIAGVLGDMDKLIENLGKRIEKKRQIKKGAMQELLTGKKRLSGFKGEWVERKIRKMLTIGHGRDYKHLANGTTPVYGSGGLMCYVDGWLHDGETVCIGRKGTIDEPMYHNGKIWTVDTLFYTHSFEDAVPKFLYYKFLMVDWLSHNAASGVPSLTSKTIEEIELLMPPSVDEQRAIAKVLSDMDAEIANLERRQEKLKLVKKGMLQDLLTGKVRLV